MDLTAFQLLSGSGAEANAGRLLNGIRRGNGIIRSSENFFQGPRSHSVCRVAYLTSQSSPWVCGGRDHPRYDGINDKTGFPSWLPGACYELLLWVGIHLQGTLLISLASFPNGVNLWSPFRWGRLIIFCDTLNFPGLHQFVASQKSSSPYQPDLSILQLVWDSMPGISSSKSMSEDTQGMSQVPRCPSCCYPQKWPWAPAMGSLMLHFCLELHSSLESVSPVVCVTFGML